MKALLKTLQNFLFCTSDEHKEMHSGLIKLGETFEGNLKLLTQRADQHEKRLDKGSEDFDDIKKSIANLDTSYAVLAEKATERRKDMEDDV